MKDPKFGGGGATIEFDCNHGRFFSGILIPQLWNLISRTFKLGAGSFLFCRRDDFFQVGGFPEYLYAGEEIKFSLSLKKLLGKTKRKFIILQEIPVITSSRKLAWYGDLKIICTLFLFFIFLFPFDSKVYAISGIKDQNKRLTSLHLKGVTDFTVFSYLIHGLCNRKTFCQRHNV